MSGIESTVYGVSDRAYKNAAKAYIRDPRRPLRLLDFLIKSERQQLIFNSLGSVGYEQWLAAREREYIEALTYVERRRLQHARLLSLQNENLPPFKERFSSG